MTLINTYIPLGTRCSSAFILRDNLKVRANSLAFDWIDAPIQNYRQFLDLDKKDIEPFLINYFSQINPPNNKHADGTWFPHDIYQHEDYSGMIESVTDKYIKRLERLHDLFTPDRHLIFITVFNSVNVINENPYFELCNFISKKNIGNCTFIAINLKNWEEGYFIQSNIYGVFNYINFYIPNTDAQFKELEAKAAENIKNNELTKSLFM